MNSTKQPYEDTIQFSDLSDLENIDKMEIYLPCGYTIWYKNLKGKVYIPECAICGEHDIDVISCFNMMRNRINLNTVAIEQKKMKVEKNLLLLKKYQDNQDYYLQLYKDDLINRIDLRREDLFRKINDYHQKLSLYIEKVIKEKREKIESDLVNLDKFKLNSNLIVKDDKSSKIDQQNFEFYKLIEKGELVQKCNEDFVQQDLNFMIYEKYNTNGFLERYFGKFLDDDYDGYVEGYTPYKFEN